MNRLLNRSAVLSCAAACVVGTSLFTSPVAFGQDEMTQEKMMNEGMHKPMMLSAEEKEQVLAQLKEMTEELSEEGERKEIEMAICAEMMKQEIAKELAKDPEVKAMITKAMASESGMMMQEEMKMMMDPQMMMQMREDLLNDEEAVEDILIKVKAMKIMDTMKKDGKKKMKNEKMESSEGMKDEGGALEDKIGTETPSGGRGNDMPAP